MRPKWQHQINFNVMARGAGEVFVRVFVAYPAAM
jgi:hypothetical protein